MIRLTWLLVVLAANPVLAQSYDYVRPTSPALRSLPAVPPSQVLPPPPLGSISPKPTSKKVTRTQPTRLPGATKTTWQPKPLPKRPLTPKANGRDKTEQYLDQVEVTALRGGGMDMSFDRFANPTAALLNYAEVLGQALTTRNRNNLPFSEGVSVLEVVLYPNYGGAVKVQGPIRIVQSGGEALDQALLQGFANQAQKELGSWSQSMKRPVRYRIAVDGKMRNFTCTLAGIIYGKT